MASSGPKTTKSKTIQLPYKIIPHTSRPNGRHPLAALPLASTSGVTESRILPSATATAKTEMANLS